MAATSPGRSTGEIPPSIDAAPRASGKRNPKPSGDGGAPLAGIRTCRQELADGRGWSTFRKRGPPVAERRGGAPGGASLLARKGGDASQGLIERLRGRRSSGASQASRVCRRSAPLDRERGMRRRNAAYPGPTKEYGRRSVGSRGLFEIRIAVARERCGGCAYPSPARGGWRASASRVGFALRVDDGAPHPPPSAAPSPASGEGSELRFARA